MSLLSANNHPRDDDDDPHANDPLPPGWSRVYSNSQKRNYYVHQETKHNQWHFPTASEAKDPWKAKQRAAEAKRKRKEEREETKKQRPDEHNTQYQEEEEDTEEKKEAKRPRIIDNNNLLERTDDATTTTTSVAIIVPYRDLHVAQQRAKHLKQFVPHMVQFLSTLQTNGMIAHFHIYIVEQSNDDRKFNRGKLLNIGFELACGGNHNNKSGRPHNVFIFHDVDLMPQPDLASWYAKFPKRPIHIARVWSRYSNNPEYFGGVVSFSSSDYKRINGVSKR